MRVIFSGDKSGSLAADRHMDGEAQELSRKKIGGVEIALFLIDLSYVHCREEMQNSNASWVEGGKDFCSMGQSDFYPNAAMDGWKPDGEKAAQDGVKSCLN